MRSIDVPGNPNPCTTMAFEAQIGCEDDYHAFELEHGDGALVIPGVQELAEVRDAGRLVALRHKLVSPVAVRRDRRPRFRQNHAACCNSSLDFAMAGSINWHLQ